MSVKIDKKKLQKELYTVLSELAIIIDNNAIEIPDWDGTYFVWRTPTGSPPAGNNCVAIRYLMPARAVGMSGIVRSKMANFATGREIYAIFTEPRRAGWDEFQGAYAYGSTPTYVLKTRAADTETSTTLTGQDWTVEHTFKLTVASGSTTFYVDGSQVAQNTTNISTVEPRWFWVELVDTSGYTFTTEGKLFLKPDAKGRIFNGVW